MAEIARHNYVKARGLGLSLGLNRFAIDLADRETPALLFSDGFDDPADWQLSLFRPIENYVLGLAVRRPQPAQVAWVNAEKALNGRHTLA